MDTFHNAFNDSTPSHVAATVAIGMKHILSGDHESAAQISVALRGLLATWRPPSVVRSEGRPRPYSILVVAHRAASEHRDLLDLLLSLDSERFQIVLVENSDGPIFPLPPIAKGNVDLIRIGANAGIGVARSLGWRIAKGEGVIIVDDDGITTSADIEKLIATFERHDSVAVRGRVANRSPSPVLPQHYDIGRVMCPRLCDIEGFSIWRRADVERIGGFDPLLYGHEGMDLTARLYPSVGHESFLYQPDALLKHDFAMEKAGQTDKLERYAAISRYCVRKNPGFEFEGARFWVSRDDPASFAGLRLRRRLVEWVPRMGDEPPVVVLATCSNPDADIGRFADALNRQKAGGFRLVVADRSGSPTLGARLGTLLDRHIPHRVLPCAGLSPGAALNRALDEMGRDGLCVVTSVEEPVIAQRVGWARAAHALFDGDTFIAFAPFRTARPLCLEQPHPLPGASLSALLLLGTGIPFSTLSFRLADVAVRFDEAPADGVEENWIERNLASGLTGAFLPLGVAFQEVEAKGDRHRRLPEALRRQAAVLGSRAAVDEDAFKVLAGWSDPPRERDRVRRAKDYGWRLFHHVEEEPMAAALKDEVLSRIARLDARLLMFERKENARLEKELADLRGSSPTDRGPAAASDPAGSPLQAAKASDGGMPSNGPHVRASLRDMAGNLGQK